MRHWQIVEEILSYDPKADEALINKAYVYAMRKHGDQKRASGAPYISHPVEVAGILARYRLDTETIVTALLHDTLEDTLATEEELTGLFGEEVTTLVKGVTKLSNASLISSETKQAENFSKLLMAISGDIRVLLVKLADRLHNMQTLEHLRPEKQKRIAQETMDYYAPMAERVGLHEIKDELQDLAFQYLDEEAYRSITTRLAFQQEGEADLVDRLVEQISDLLKQGGLDARVFGRLKRPFSIWRKMRTKKVAFESMSDVIAFRVIVGSVEECYQALGVIHTKLQMVPGRFKDYISTPKANRYQSLHTTLIAPGGRRIELQIRTGEMDELAEYGVAAHWHYKTGGDGQKAPDLEQNRWLQQLLDILQESEHPAESYENVRENMFVGHVLCFTPKGKLVELPTGAIGVDFAYALHTELGDTCVGIKVNGKNLPATALLNNGDSVEVLTSSGQLPQEEWIGNCQTGRARSGIRRCLRQHARANNVANGRKLVEKVFLSADLKLTENGLEQAVEKLMTRSVDDLMEAVGAGTFTDREVLHAVYPGESRKRETRRAPRVETVNPALLIKGVRGDSGLEIADCCCPVPGDRIVGIQMGARGTYAHAIDCPALEGFTSAPERWQDVGWDMPAVQKSGAMHVGRIRLDAVNKRGALSSITAAIARADGNIDNLRITKKETLFFEMILGIDVRDAQHLSDIIAALRAEPDVNNVDRVRGWTPRHRQPANDRRTERAAS